MLVCCFDLCSKISGLFVFLTFFIDIDIFTDMSKCLPYLLKSGLNQVGWKHIAEEDNYKNRLVLSFSEDNLHYPRSNLI